MGVMEKLKIFVVKEPVVAASCLIAGFGLFLPAVVRPILDSWETAEKVPPPPLNEVVERLAFGVKDAVQAGEWRIGGWTTLEFPSMAAAIDGEEW
ncbi:hypothetical protein HU200_019024 [Digitaria exilis]|uniref:Uncharacterized protein n=1 Tax=Digitaria exilis TaxID=1010633 RepID=A0A835KDK0_9POAL|nr:hypothetical protein HU200_019024 [Digitaria exilis]